MIRFVSNQGDYDFYVSTDPAFVQRPSEPPEGASDEQLTAYKTALEDYAAKLQAARKTGDYSTLLIEGKSPTKFVLGQVDRPTFRAVLDRVQMPFASPRRIGDMALHALMFRLAIRSIPALDKKIEYKRDPQWDDWRMAPAELVDDMDRTHPSIVSDIGMYVFLKTTEIDPLT